MAKTQSKSNIKSNVGVMEPKRFGVILHNDDFTTMEFVVKILKQVFHKSEADAETIMMQVHRQGKGLAGVYSYDIACTKANIAEEMARQEGFPLKLTVEEV